MTQKEFCDYVELINKKNKQKVMQLWKNKFKNMKTKVLNETILHMSVKSGDTEIINFILNKGMEIDERDADGTSPLQLATYNGNDKVTNLLIEHGADVNLCDNNGWSPLYCAAVNGNYKITNILIEHGANVNLCDDDGWSALHRATSNRNDKITSKLIAHGANVNLCDNNGWSPLYCAAINNNDKISNILIEHGADVNLCNNDGWSPLHRAVCFNNYKVTSLLIEHGAYINLCNNDGWTPLYCATNNGNDKITNTLIKHGADVNLCDNDGWSPLHRATRNSSDKIISILIEHGADVNLCNNTGWSPLYCASRNGDDKIARMLIKYGANINLCDNNGMTPLDLAQTNEHQKCVSILKEALHKRDIMQTDNVELFKWRYAINGLELDREIINLIGQIRPVKIIEYIISSPITKEEISVPEIWQDEPFMHEINLYRSIQWTQYRMFENSGSIELINKDVLLDKISALQLAIDSQSEIMINEVMKLLKNDNNIIDTLLDTNKGKNNKFLNILRKRKCALDAFIKRGYSRLDIAVMDCSRKMLLYLLENEKNTEVITQALSLAIEHNCEECISILSEKNVQYSYVNKMGQTLLHLAVESGNTAVCHTLVDKCSDLTKKDYFGFTALQRAVTYNEKDIIEQMINKDKYWNTILHIAKPKEVTCFEPSENSNVELHKMYQKQLHSIYDKLTDTETTLSLHIKANDVISEEILRNISERDIEFVDGLGNTMLHTAVSNCNIEICRTIINISKKTLNMKNSNNISPLRLAVQMAKDSATDKNNILNIIQCLITMGAQLEQNEPETKSILQEAITTANEKLLIVLIESEETVTTMTEKEFKFITEHHFFTFLRHLAGKLNKDLAFKLITEGVVKELFLLEQYSTLMHLISYLNCEVRKAIMNEYLYVAYQQRNEDLFTKLCSMNEFEIKLLNNGESIMTHIIKDDNKAYLLHILEATHIQKLANTPNCAKEFPLHLIIRKKWFNLAHLLLRETKIVDEENSEGDTAMGILIKQLENNMDNIEETNEILNLVYTMIDKSYDIYKVNNASGRNPISYSGKYRFKIEQYYEKHDKVKQTCSTKKVTKICQVCDDREINCVLDCGHAFCTACVEQVHSCPKCRTQITNAIKMCI